MVDQHSQSQKLLVRGDRQLQLHALQDAIHMLQQAAYLAVAIKVEPFQKYATAKTAALQQPAMPQLRRGMSQFFRRKGGHDVLFGVSAFFFVLVVQWLRQR